VRVWTILEWLGFSERDTYMVCQRVARLKLGGWSLWVSRDW
jgi:hypothetical protein